MSSFGHLANSIAARCYLIALCTLLSFGSEAWGQDLLLRGDSNFSIALRSGAAGEVCPPDRTSGTFTVTSQVSDPVRPTVFLSPSDNGFDISASSCDTTLNPGDSCEVTVQLFFEPEGTDVSLGTEFIRVGASTDFRESGPSTRLDVTTLECDGSGGSRDVEPPVLESFFLDPDKVDVTDSPAIVNIELVLADESGISNVETITFVGPSGETVVSSQPSPVVTAGEIFNASVRFPAGTEAGDWTALPFSVTDFAGNRGLLSARDVSETGVVVVVNDSDITPPILESFELNPQAVDVTDSAQTVEIEVLLVDDSGVSGVGAITFDGPSGETVVSSTPIPIDSSVDVFIASVEFPRGATAGSWAARSFSVVDFAGNVGVVSAADVNRPGIVAVFDNSDNDAPILESISLSDDSVDVTNSAQRVDIKILLFDDTDVTEVESITFVGPSGASIISSAPVLQVFDFSDGFEFSAFVDFPRGTEVGDWIVQPFSASDSLGNRATFSPRGVFVSVESSPDTEPPQLGSFSVDPRSVDVTVNSQIVDIEFELLDDSGVSLVSPITFVGPTGASVVSSGPIPNDSFVDLFNATVEFPQGSAAGDWIVQPFLVSDVLMNEGNVSPSGSVVVINNVDNTPPTVNLISLSPDRIDTAFDSVLVLLDFSASDDLSGISEVSAITFTSPSGQATVEGSLTEVTRSGTPETIFYQATFNFPQLSETGFWMLDSFNVTDNAGNLNDFAVASEGVLVENTAPLADQEVTMVASQVRVDESAGVVEIALDRLGDERGVVTALIVTSPEVSDDFEGATSNAPFTVTWEEGVTGRQTIPIRIVDDTLPEASESFDVRILSASSVIDNFPTSSSNVSILSDTTNVVIEANDVPDDGIDIIADTDFGPLVQGSDPVSQPVFFTNNTQLEIVFSSVSDFGSESPFSIAGGSCTTLPSDVLSGGASCEFEIEFNPVEVGISTDALSIDLRDQAFSGDLLSENFDIVFTGTVTEAPRVGVVQMAQTELTLSESADTFSLGVVRLGGSDGTISVDYVFTDGSATADEDFTGISGTLVFEDGDTETQFITGAVLTDELEEGNETFTVSLTTFTPTEALGDDSMLDVVITIEDEFVAPPVLERGEIQFAQRSLSVGEEDDIVEVVVERVGGSDGSVSVLLDTNAGTASSDLDYANTTQTLQWENGDSNPQTVTIDILPDQLVEETETFTVTLNDPQPNGEILGTPDTLTVSITDVPPLRLGVVQMAQTELTLSESADTFSLGVVRLGGSDGTISVDYEFTDGSATAEEDFTGMSGTLVFEDGDTETQFITGAVLTDELEEGNETFTVSLTSITPTEALGDDSMLEVLITIEDEFEAPPVLERGQIQFAQTSLTVGEEVGAVEVVVERIGGSDGSVSVLLDTNAGTASSDLDYANTTQMLQWEDGDSDPQTITIDILADQLAEETENFTVTLNDPQPNAGILGEPDTLIISISDVPPPLQPGVVQMAQTELTLSESADTFSLGVVRLGGSDGTISVDYEFTDGSATADEDFTGMSGTLVFEDGDTETQFITGAVLTDELEEGNETFTVSLTTFTPTEALGDDSMLDVVITIEDEFVAPPVLERGEIQFAQRSLSVGEEDDIVEVVVERVGGSDGSVSVLLDTNAGTASSDLDYANTTQMLQWEDGDSDPQSITIDILPDQLVEETETFTVTLNDPQPNAEILGTPDTLTVSITDVRPLRLGVVQMAQTELTLSESADTFSLGVVRLGGSDGTISVDYEFTDGSATADEDFTGMSGTLVFEDGDTETQFITGAVLPDELEEGNETFTVSLTTFTPTEALGNDSMLDVVITIEDEFVAPPVLERGQIQFAQTSLTVGEEVGAVEVVVERIGGSDGSVSVLLDTNAGTASSDLDYANTTQMLQWEDGDSDPQTVTIDILADQLAEEMETFTVTLNDPQPNAEILGDPDTLTISISDVPPPLQPGVVQMAQTELTLSESADTFSLGVVRLGGSDGTISVDYEFTNGSATADEDFTGMSGTLVFEGGDTETQFITGTVLPDELEEGNETFTVSLTSITPAEALGDDSMLDVLITIEDEFEAPPVLERGQIQFAQTSLTVGEEDGAVEVVVERVGGSDGSVSVLLDTNASTASSGLDYTNTTQMLQWEDGDSDPQSITIDILADQLVEETETFTVTLNDPQPNAEILGTPDTLTVSITDVPPLRLGVVRMVQTELTLSESADTFSLGVVRLGGSDGSISVDYEFTDGSATANEDFTGMSGTLVFADGDTETQFITGTVLPDELEEGNETFTVSLTSTTPVEALGADSTLDVVITIEDEFVAPPVLERGQIRFAQASVNVGEEDGAVEVVVERIGGSDGSVSVLLDTNAGTASSDLDYANTTQMLQWEDGDSDPQSITIDILADQLVEETETFTVTLNDPQPNAEVLGTPNTLTVSIDDVPPLQLGVVQMAQTELTLSESADTFSLGVVRLGGSDGTISVDYEFTNGSATADEDFIGMSGTLVFADGDTETQFITGAVLPDELEEGNETFTVSLTGVTPAEALGDDSMLDVVITIEDEFVAPPVLERGQIQFAQTGLTVGEEDGAVEVLVERVGGSDGSVSVLLDTNAGTASSGLDYVNTTQMLQWDDGDVSARTVTIGILTDLLIEDAEDFAVSLTNPQPNADILGAANTLTISITDVPPPLQPGVVQMAQGELSVPESADTFSLGVVRLGGSDGAISVNYEFANGTATADEDFTGISGTLVFADGDSETQFITGAVLADQIEEGDETFTLRLTSATPAETLGDESMLNVVITIKDEFETPPMLEPGQVQFVQSSLSVGEEEESIEVVIERVGGTDGSVSVLLDTNAGTAENDTDYVNTTEMLQWEDGDDSQRTITIGILSDIEIEDTETFTVTLNDPQPNAQILGTPDTLTVSITDVPPPLQTGVIQMAQTELTLSESADLFSLGVVRLGGSDGEIIVNYEFTSGTAVVDEDFTGTGGTLVFADGDTETQVITGAVLTDELEEGDETFTVSLTTITPVDSLGDESMQNVVITIEDEFEAAPVLERGQLQFAQAAVSVSELSESVDVVVQRVGGSDGNVSVLLDTNAGSASNDSDYVNTTQLLQWEDGDTSERTVSVGILADLEIEEIETFTVTLTNPQPDAQVLGTPDTLTISITDVPPPVILQPGLIQFADAAAIVNEDAGTVTLTVTRSGGSDGTAQVDFRTVADTAQADLDFISQSGTLTWADGDATDRTITINLVPDAVKEELESFFVQLTNPVSSVPGLVIGSDDEAVVSLLNVVVPEGPSPGVLRFVQTDLNVAESDGEVILRVVREGGSDGAASVQYSIEGDTALAGDDFVGQTGELNWSPGETGERTIRIEVLADAQLEDDETFSVTLSDAVLVGDAEELSDAVAVVTLTDSTQSGELFVLQSALTVSETIGELLIDIERREGSAGAVQVDVSTTDESASRNVDYQLDTAQLVWADGEDGVQQIRLRILDDELDEPAEQLSINLAISESGSTNASRLTLNLSSLSIAILDNDAPIQGDAQPGSTVDTASFRMRVIGGDNQIGLPGEEIAPIIIEVFDPNNDDAVVPEIMVNWRVIPAGSVEFLSGDVGITDAEGRASLRVRVVERGFNTLIGSINSGSASPVLARSDIEIAESEVAVIVRGGLVASAGLGNNQSKTANALDQICEILGVRIENGVGVSAAQRDLFETCVEIRDQLDAPELAASLDRLAGEELFALDDSVLQINNIQTSNIYSRLNAVRSGRGEAFDVSGLQLQIYNQNIPGSVVNAAQNELSGGAASADAFANSRLGVFVNGTLSYGEVDGKGLQRGGDISSRGITLGVDYRATNETVFGVGVGLARTDTDFNADEGSSNVDAINVMLYGTWYKQGKGYLDAVFDLGRNEYNLNRRVNLPGAVTQFATGSTDADVASLTIGVGRDFTKGNWEFGPYGRASILRADMDGFSERTSTTDPGFGSALDYSSRSIRSSTLSIGGQITRTINTKRAIFLPQLRVEFEAENQQQKDPIRAEFQNDPTNTSFEIDGNDRDSSHLNLGLGTSFVLPRGHSGYFFYEKQTRNSLINQDWLKLGVRLEF